VAADHVDRVGEAAVAGRLHGLEVVERAEDVVVPARREGEERERRLDGPGGTVGAKEPVDEEKFAPRRCAD
jgi:hypothetical protein